jgi:hypothetical protein
MIDDNRNPTDRAYDEMMAQLHAQPMPNSKTEAKVKKEAKDPPARRDEYDAFDEMYMEYLEQFER